ncbi:HNH endonuclease signature motif containing protein [Peribacillus frigoritolerans]|uniref:HNH endonuclease n=1 Tax=Peribacillus frigoritolerans TaxID=450367 RepID=UPI0032B55704
MDNERKVFERIKKDYYKIHPKVCNRCYSPNKVELHHIIPLLEGGTHNFDNLIPLCFECHREWHGRHCDHQVYGEWYRIHDSQRITFSDFLEKFAGWEEKFAINNGFIDDWSFDRDYTKEKKVMKELREARKKEILMNPVEIPKKSERTFEYPDCTWRQIRRRKKLLYELRGNKWHLIQK